MRRFWDNVMALADRPEEEQLAIREYCRGAHPTNVPQNLDTARWGFSYDSRTGKLIAAVCY